MARPVEKIDEPSALELAWKEQLEAEKASTVRRATPKQKAVIVFGRFNPPTTGHERLITTLAVEAARRKASALIFPSPRSDGKDNPLTFVERVKWLRQMFPGIWVNDNVLIRNPLDALYVLNHIGFDAIWFVVGSDQTTEFERLGRYVKPRGRRGGKFIILKQFGVITCPKTRNPKALDDASMSATKLREAAQRNDFRTFRLGTPTRNAFVAKQIFETVRRRLHETTSLSPVRNDGRIRQVVERSLRAKNHVSPRSRNQRQ